MLKSFRDDVPVEKQIEDLYRQNKKLAMISLFAAGIAHDYNNALTAVLGNISLARFEAEGNKELAELITDAEKASMRIKTMTERLSTYAKGVKLNKEKFDLVSAARHVYSRYLPGCSSCTFTSDEDVMEVDADSLLLEMAIDCLVANSIEATAGMDAKIDLNISYEEIDQEQGFREISLIPGRYVRLSIKDNGAGFSPEYSSEIFDPYFTTKENHDGIGLALSYTIMKRHKGYISAASSREGALFSIYIPLF